MAIRCAERTGTCTMLRHHEFYMVMEPQYGEYMYQALEFIVGTSLPLDEVKGYTAKLKKEIWVRGVAYAPALPRHCMFGNSIKRNRVKVICSTQISMRGMEI